ncbi:MAG: hypothetical protein ABR552_09935 [Actinomycetota bacterium]
MKKSAMKLALLALVVGSLSMFGAHADPFGSSENLNGDVSCGAGTVVPSVGTVSTVNNSSYVGVEGCAPSSGASQLPIRGRVGVYKDSSNTVTVFADGASSNPGGSGWDRLRVGPGKVCFDRGNSGDYYTSGQGDVHACAP